MLPENKQAAVSVCAAYIESGGRCLICDRPEGSFMAGGWEFPGGKIDPGETAGACLAREIKEELGMSVRVLDQMFFTEHKYPEKTVRLFFFRCLPNSPCERPEPAEGQNCKWVDPKELERQNLLPADIAFARFLAMRQTLAG